MLSKFRSPVFFLTFCNLFSAAVSFVSGMLVARWVGANGYGIIGIISAVNATALNFVDIRLQDLLAKLYFEKQLPDGTDQLRFRASIIQSGLICYGALAAFFLVAGLAANLVFTRLFTSSRVDPEWMVASALGLSITYFLNPIGFLLRLSGRFFVLGTQAMIVSLLSGAVMIGCTYISKDLNGYYLGFLLSNLLGATVALAVSFTVWLRYDKLPLLSSLDLSALRMIRGNRRFLLWGNFLGYIKLGHRSADVLLVSFFCNDGLTGIYKLARNLTDKLYMLFDALNQVYYPIFMRLLSEGNREEYRRLARRILLGALGLTTIFLVAGVIGLPFFEKTVLKGAFPGLEPTILILTIPFFFVTGMYIWIWPLVLHRNLAGRFTILNGIALIAQYGIGVLMFLSLDRMEAFPAGYVGYYLVLMLLSILLLRRESAGATAAAGTGPL